MKTLAEMLFQKPKSTPDAQSMILREFNEREVKTVNYLIEALKQSLEHLANCEFEMQLNDKGTDKWKSYKRAADEAQKKQFLIRYIGQCLEIDFDIDYQTRTFTINKFKS